MFVALAHPDDESFGMGGTLAAYARQGVEIHLVCLTDGQAGTVDPHHLNGYNSIAELRAAELRCAAQTLGLASVEVGWYRDSGMPGSPENAHPEALVQQPVDAVAARLASHIRTLRPQVVVTHDPIGGYRHPDHIAVHHATLRAFELAADPAFEPDAASSVHQVKKLYYTTFPKTFLRMVVFFSRLVGKDPRKFGRNHDIDLLSLVEDGNFPIHARIRTTHVIEVSEKANACHASQLEGGPGNGVFGFIWRILGTHDTYMRAYPPAPPRLKEKDLFENVV